MIPSQEAEQPRRNKASKEREVEGRAGCRHRCGDQGRWPLPLREVLESRRIAHLEGRGLEVRTFTGRPRASSVIRAHRAGGGGRAGWEER